jgi:hypothetical protein
MGSWLWIPFLAAAVLFFLAAVRYLHPGQKPRTLRRNPRCRQCRGPCRYGRERDGEHLTGRERAVLEGLEHALDGQPAPEPVYPQRREGRP